MESLTSRGTMNQQVGQGERANHRGEETQHDSSHIANAKLRRLLHLKVNRFSENLEGKKKQGWRRGLRGTVSMQARSALRSPNPNSACRSTEVRKESSVRWVSPALFKTTSLAKPANRRHFVHQETRVSITSQ